MTAMILWLAAGGLAGLLIGLRIGKRRQRRQRTSSTADSFLKLLKH